MIGRWARARGVSGNRRSFTSRTTPLPLPALHTAADVNAVLSLMYGPHFLDSVRAPCVSHITSALPLHGDYYTLRIHSQTPQSLYDKFVLSVARARCDLIVLTGAILRAEPQLTANLFVANQALRQWRKSLGLTSGSADVCILTHRAANLDPGHPIFCATTASSQDDDGEASRVFIYTGVEAPVDFLVGSGSDQPTVIRSKQPSLASLLADFRSSHPVVSIECGPSSTSSVYQAMTMSDNKNGMQLVDEVLLSTYNAPVSPTHLSELVVPSAWSLSDSFLSTYFARQSQWTNEQWTFERFARRQP